MTGATGRQRVPAESIRSLDMPIPPIQIQQKIEQLKQVQQNKMESLKALKASILDKAFRGEL